MTDAGWRREPDFTEVARKLVLKINEIQPDQWDQYDDKDQARIMAALKASYKQGRVEGIGECKDLVDSFAEAYLLASMVAHSLSSESHKCMAEFVSSIGGEIAKLAQQAQEGGVGDGHNSDNREG